MTVARPASRPNVPHFSSGPCAKRPGWNPQNLKDAALGRSHRAKVGKAKLKLGWVPEISVQTMCAEMVATDLQDARRHALLKQHGYAVPVATER